MVDHEREELHAGVATWGRPVARRGWYRKPEMKLQSGLAFRLVLLHWVLVCSVMGERDCFVVDPVVQSCCPLVLLSVLVCGVLCTEVV